MGKSRMGSKSCIAAGSACFPVAAVFLAYAVLCVINMTVVSRMPRDDYGEYYILLLFAYLGSKILYPVYFAGTIFFSAIAAVHIFIGVMIISNASADNLKRCRAYLIFPLVSSILFICFSFVRFCIGLGRFAVHGYDREPLGFILVGMLPLVFSTVCLVLDRIAAKNLGADGEAAKISEKNHS